MIVQVKNLAYAALVISILPLIYTHDFLAMCLLAFILMLGEFIGAAYKKKWRDLLAILKRWSLFFALPVLILGVPQFAIVFPWGREHFIRYQFGWMKGGENIFGFWFRNIFPAIFIFPAAYAMAPKKHRTFYNALFAIFILANLIVFQPYDYDNMKFMLWWYLGSLILSVMLFQYAIDTWKWKGAIMTTVLFFSMTLIGGISVYRATQASWSWRLFTPADMQLAGFVKADTKPSDIFLTDSSFTDPINCLAGRDVLGGYTGWLWSHGIDYDPRFADISEMYSGKADSLSLMKKYDVSYALINDNYAVKLPVNEKFFDDDFKKVFENDNYKLYQIKASEESI